MMFIRTTQLSPEKAIKGFNVLVQREMEFSGLKISYCILSSNAVRSRCKSPQLLPTALRFARLVAYVEPPQQIPRTSESAVALSAGVGFVPIYT